MTISSLPKMFVSEQEGWSEMVRMHPSVKNLLWYVVIPLSVLAAAMYVFAELFYTGMIFPRLEPALSVSEALVVGGTFSLAEVLMVGLMAVFIKQMGEGVGAVVPYENAFALAAIAPVPFWLAALALFVPSLSVNVAVLSIAWVGSIALIRHGVRPLIGLQDTAQIKKMANMVTFSGVVAWVAVMIVLAFLLSTVLGFR